MMRFLQIWALFLGLMTLTVTGPGRLQAAGVNPIVDQGWLLGGFSQGKWLSAEDTAKALQGGETYQLCTLTQPLGKGRGSKPKHNPSIEVGPEFGLTFTPAPKGREPVVAMGATWNAMPRQPRLLTENLQPYITAAAEILKSQGIADPEVKLTQVVEIDLDGDGLKEVLVCARRFTVAHLSDVLKAGDYSMVFLHKPAKTTGHNILITGQFQTAALSEPGLPLTWRIMGLVDANGDGVMEILADYTYYEGGGARLYQLKGEKLELVLAEDWGA
jgi:hypothetical protein